MTVLAAGCAAAPDAGQSYDDVPRPLGVGEHGFEMRTWIIDDDPEHVIEVLDRWSSSEASETGERDSDAFDRGAPVLQTEAMTRNGLRWTRVPIDSLDELAGELGGLHRNIRTWHGQQHHWAPAYRHDVRRGGEAVAIDGRVRRFDEGRLRLMIRGWTLPTEHGPRFYIELMPMHRPPGRGVDHPLLDRRPDPDEPFTSMALHATLDPGWAYVLTGHPPRMIAGEQEEGAGAVELAPAGPEADLPGTFGETLFRRRATPPRRVLLVLIPYIPEALVPEPLEADRGRGEAEGAAS